MLLPTSSNFTPSQLFWERLYWNIFAVNLLIIGLVLTRLICEGDSNTTKFSYFLVHERGTLQINISLKCNVPGCRYAQRGGEGNPWSPLLSFASILVVRKRSSLDEFYAPVVLIWPFWYACSVASEDSTYWSLSMNLYHHDSIWDRILLGGQVSNQLPLPVPLFCLSL